MKNTRGTLRLFSGFWLSLLCGICMSHTSVAESLGHTTVVDASAATSRAQVANSQFIEDTKRYFSRLAKLGFAGVVGVMEGEETVIADGFGLANREKELLWTPQTTSTVGSITKQFTAAAIMVLQEQGKVNVHDTLGTFFRDVPRDKAGITLHHLLTHSSGIVDPPGIRDFDRNTRDEYVRAILDAPLAFPPGILYEYANANFSLLGAIIEMQTGTNYEGALRELIFNRAGLTETGYTAPQWAEDRFAQGYEGAQRWGTILERPMAEDGPFWALRANGGIYSTSTDMLRWARALLDGRVMSPHSRDAMWTPHVDETGEGRSFYGYGWVVLDTDAGIRIITHNGGNGILFADYAIVPEKDLVVFLQTNVVSDFQKANRLVEEILQRAFQGKPYPDVPDVVDRPRKQLERWEGTYTLENGERLDVTMDGSALRVEPHGWRAYAAVHSVAGQALDPLVDMSKEIDRIVSAYVAGDFGPLHEAYHGQASIERLGAAYEERTREWEERFGLSTGYEVLGTGTGTDYHFTLVRFNHERDSILRAYVWARGDERKLLGMTPRRIDPACRFYPVRGGAFESWEVATGASVTARLEEASGGSVLFVERDDGAVRARRQP